ncbi:beta-N-acetylhexosaminidase [Pedobacter sp. ASV12]|uniref:beta-N-acetylhexosaminidase n=1 Tax=Pedobacter sp. ASV12 TaxID=2795120 RepID=UPI0018ECFA44|nr:beta-N-acetylhexosaminidase [Pedobacter sp. ASV12]
MNKVLCTIFLGLLGLGLRAQAPLAIIPYPKQVTVQTGTFTFDQNTTVFALSEELQSQQQYLRHSLFQLYGLNFYPGKDKKATIVLKLSGKPGVKGAYQLTVNPLQIVIEAPTGNGVFNGIQSLLQLLRGAGEFKNSLKIPSLLIKDEPLYQWRGFMLDESRHFFGKKKVKALLDWMALYKLNRFHWHLTDEPAWRLAIKKYPMLTLIGGIGTYTDPNEPAQYYSQADVQEIVAYAATRFIEVIPEIDMPGHATAANRAYPAFTGGGSKDHPEFTFNPGKEKTYAYLANILQETQLLFPSNLIHLGGDEVSFGNEKWNADSGITALKQQHGLANNLAVERYFMKRMADSVFAMQGKVAVWDEMVDAGLPVENTVIFWWRHDKPIQLEQALDKGYATVLCPRLPLYFDFVQDKSHQHGRKWDGKFNDLLAVYHFDVAAFTSKPTTTVLGLQANLWTETVQNEQRFDYLVFPRLAALAAAAWTAPAARNDEQFLDQVKIHIDWYKKAGLNFYNPFNPIQTPEPASKRRLPLNYKD